ncbi:MAG: redoxin domain-containing protein [Saprospiraceae bacterium]|nr:redoxin domain-containing protein [Saprospiraceae bacterium]
MRKAIIFCVISIFCLAMSNDLMAQSNEITVFVAISEECPICKNIALDLNVIAERFSENVQLVLLFPFRISNYKTMHQFKEKYNLLKWKGMLDEDQSKAKSLGLSVTPEAIVMDKNGVVLYQGRINDLYNKPGKKNHNAQFNDLSDAIEASLNGIIVKKPWHKAVGCYITFEN